MCFVLSENPQPGWYVSTMDSNFSDKMQQRESRLARVGIPATVVARRAIDPAPGARFILLAHDVPGLKLYKCGSMVWYHLFTSCTNITYTSCRFVFETKQKKKKKKKLSLHPTPFPTITISIPFSVKFGDQAYGIAKLVKAGRVTSIGDRRLLPHTKETQLEWGAFSMRAK